MRQRGVTLIELVISIVVIAIAAALLTIPFSTVLGSITLEDDIRRASQLVNECAEQALGKRRKPGSFAGLVNGTYTADEANNPCRSSVLSLPAGFSRTVAICDASSAGSCPNASCTAGWSCKRVDVSVAKGSYTASAAFMVIDY
jgi:prepilin-type N-terminal cleavage/methylation domain-containing protein